MAGRLALGLTVVVVAATYQPSRALEATSGDTVAERTPGDVVASDTGGTVSAAGRPDTVPPATPAPGVPFSLRAYDQPKSPSFRLTDPFSLAPDGGLVRFPAGDFTLTLTKPWSARDPMRSGSSSLIETLQALGADFRIEYPLSSRTAFEVGVRPFSGDGPEPAAGGGLYIIHELGNDLTVGAGIEARRGFGQTGRTHSRFGSSFSVSF